MIMNSFPLLGISHKKRTKNQEKLNISQRGSLSPRGAKAHRVPQQKQSDECPLCRIYAKNKKRQPKKNPGFWDEHPSKAKNQDQ